MIPGDSFFSFFVLASIQFNSIQSQLIHNSKLRMIQEEINNFHRQLKAALKPDCDSSALEEIVVDVLHNILNKQEEISAEILEASKIAITMKSLRSIYPKNQFIVTTSKTLIHSWKQVYRDHLCEVRRRASSNNSTSSVDPRTKAKSFPVNTGDEAMQHCMKFNTFTITFGDQAENHVGMQKIGTLSSEGFTLDDLLHAQEWFRQRGVHCDLISLHEDLLPAGTPVDEAYVLVARNGVTAFGSDEHEGGEERGEAFKSEVFREQVRLHPDKQAFMYGRVVNKHARYNLCFGDFDQEADYENGKGTVVSFQSLPSLQTIRESLPAVIGHKAQQLEAEGNYYYDLAQCGIGFHGDAERMKVVALRLGASMDLAYAWFHQSKPISARRVISLHHGDMYFMSQKATGQDWRKKVIPTLRHAAGARKFTQLPTGDKKKK